jgi:hypothetical protein
VIFQSPSQLTSAAAMGLNSARSRVRGCGLSEPRRGGVVCDGGTVELVGRDLAALREPEQHRCARGSDQCDHDRAGTAVGEQIRDLPGRGSEQPGRGDRDDPRGDHLAHNIPVHAREPLAKPRARDTTGYDLGS